MMESPCSKHSRSLTFFTFWSASPDRKKFLNFRVQSREVELKMMWLWICAWRRPVMCSYCRLRLIAQTKPGWGDITYHYSEHPRVLQRARKAAEIRYFIIGIVKQSFFEGTDIVWS